MEELLLTEVAVKALVLAASFVVVISTAATHAGGWLSVLNKEVR